MTTPERANERQSLGAQNGLLGRNSAYDLAKEIRPRLMCCSVPLPCTMFELGVRATQNSDDQIPAGTTLLV